MSHLCHKIRAVRLCLSISAQGELVEFPRSYFLKCLFEKLRLSRGHDHSLVQQDPSIGGFVDHYLGVLESVACQ